MANQDRPLRLVADRRPSEPEQPRDVQEPLWRHALGDRLRRTRHDRGETLTGTASRAGVSPQYLSEIERGTKEPSSEMIAAVAGALELSLLQLTLAVADDLRAVHIAAASPTRQAGQSGRRGAYQGYLLAA